MACEEFTRAMIPPDELIREWAYYQWERQGHRQGYDVEDWLAAEDHLKIWINYRPVSLYYLTAKPKVILGARRGRCRFCGKGNRQTTFSKVSHSLPEFLGNKSVISKDECDRCNEFFGRYLEDHMSKMTMPLRTVLGISGKRGVPSFKSKAGKARLDHDVINRNMLITESYDDTFTTTDEVTRTISINIPAQPYVPVAVLKCFSKIALSIMPDGELRHFPATLRWIREPDHARYQGAVKGAGCYVYFTPNPFRTPWVMLLSRVDPFARQPYMILLIGTGRVLLHACVPMSEMDRPLAGCQLEMPRLASHLLSGCVLASCHSIPLDTSMPIHETVGSIDLTFTESIRLPTASAELPPY